MSSSANKFHNRVYGLHEQAARIRLICPDFTYTIRGGELIGQGSMQPAPRCLTYLFALSYRVGENPKVTIIDPPLRCRADQSKIPHTYGTDEPCVFRPGVDWSKADSVATTIIPWLATWLFYYEVWHATGEWCGGGEHPDVSEEDNETKTTVSDEE